MDGWLALERTLLVALAAVAAAALVRARRQPAFPGGPIAAAAAAAMLFLVLYGVRVAAPSEHLWLFKRDWRIHFLGWHFFRNEPWHWPPGRIDSYFAPLGTSIGYTDSIPLLALALKPVAPFVAAPFQYFGAWLWLCYTLHGFIAAHLVRVWSGSPFVQAAGGLCLTLLPSLWLRDIHPALSAHWLLLWALWIYLRVDDDGRARPGAATMLGIVAGLVHPYLAVMSIALLGAAVLRLFVEARRTRRWALAAGGLAMGATATTAVLAGWWLSGLFLLGGSDSLGAAGFAEYSMNLLAPITPSGWSRLLPEWPIATEAQASEGLHYFGAGILALFATTVVVWALRPAVPMRVVWWPLALVCLAMTVYAFGPHLTLGARVLVRYDAAWTAALVFRAAGRFFWPAAYLLSVLSLATLAVRLPPRWLVPLLLAAIALQVYDLSAVWLPRRSQLHTEAWYTFPHPLVSPAWDAALPHYDRVVLYPPPQCGPPPTTFEALAYLAGRHGLSINGGHPARVDAAAVRASCDRLSTTLAAGRVEPGTLYVGPVESLAGFRATATPRVVCGVIDGVAVCVSPESYTAWAGAAHLE